MTADQITLCFLCFTMMILNKPVNSHITVLWSKCYFAPITAVWYVCRLIFERVGSLFFMFYHTGCIHLAECELWASSLIFLSTTDTIFLSCYVAGCISGEEVLYSLTNNAKNSLFLFDRCYFDICVLKKTWDCIYLFFKNDNVSTLNKVKTKPLYTGLVVLSVVKIIYELIFSHRRLNVKLIFLTEGKEQGRGGGAASWI